MKLYAKLLLGFGSLWVVFFSATVVTMYALQHNGAALAEAFHSDFDSVVYGARMKAAIDEVNRLTLSAIWKQPPPTPVDLEKAWGDFQIGKEGELHNITLPGEADLAKKLFDLTDQYRAATDRFFRAPDPNRSIIYRDELISLYSASRSAAQAIVDLNLTHNLKVEARLRENLDSVRRVQIIFVVCGAGLAGFCVLVLAKTILGPLRVLTGSARRIESGDLDLTVAVQGRDELGELAAAFNAMAAKLREYRQIDHARLLRTQQTTQLAIDSLPDAVAVFNPAGEVEISNQQARQHFGLHPGRRQSETHLEWLPDLFVVPMATGRPVEPVGYQSAVQLFDRGEERFLLPRAVPMFGDSKQVIGVVVILVDVTRLRRADELKSGLVATVSHELMTPLAATQFSVHLLAQETVSPLSDQQRRLVHAACEGADRLHRVIENLLRFQRIEEGQYLIRNVPMRPAQIVSQVLDPMRGEFGDRRLTLSTAVPENLPLVNADPDLIGYVLNNLLSNALKFVPGPGKVEISATPHADGVHFCVADTGPGIPPEHLANIFQRFYRAAALANAPGSGLGLAIARQLVEAQGGRIFATPRDAGGIAFTFVLPFANSSTPPQ